MLVLKTFACLITFSGCAIGWRAGGGALADTEGRVGLVGSGAMAFGIKLGHEQGLLEVLEAGVGPSLVPAEGIFTGALGIDWLHQELFGDKVGLRAGIRFRYLGRLGSDGFVQHLGAGGGALGLLFILDRGHDRGHEKMGGGGTSWHNLSIEIQGLYSGLFDPDPRTGMFLLSLSYEVNSLVNFF
jgi:hypothetical protein